MNFIPLTECNSDKTQKLSFGVNSTIEFQNTATAPDNTGVLVSWNIPRQMTFLSYVVIFCYPNHIINSKWAIFGLCHYCIQWAICPVYPTLRDVQRSQIDPHAIHTPSLKHQQNIFSVIAYCITVVGEKLRKPLKTWIGPFYVAVNVGQKDSP
jgi:hypothetical protein